MFIFTSTNKIYGDVPNRLPLVEQEGRWEIASGHTYSNGIREDMAIDQTLHSLFGLERWRLRAGPGIWPLLPDEDGLLPLRVPDRPRSLRHPVTRLPGLPHEMRCQSAPYTVFGYRGKQVRDNIHSNDLIRAFHEFFKALRRGEVYNMGGGRYSHCSMLEAIAICEQISGKELNWTYSEQNRTGDHIWWISDVGKFRGHYPGWNLQYDVVGILREIYAKNVERWQWEG